MVERTLFRRSGIIAGVVLLDDEDADLAEHRWHLHPKGYAMRQVRQQGRARTVFLHRVILERMVGPLGPGQQTDHIDRNQLNNRRCNLRAVTHQQNMRNRGVWSQGGAARSRYRGVTWHTRDHCWQASIRVDTRLQYLGTFLCEEDAARAYDRAARACLGDEAQPNFP